MTDQEILALDDEGRLPMSERGRELFELGSTLARALNPETMFAKRTTMVFEPIPWGKGTGWICYDSRTWDGPEESVIGSGPEKQDALVDYESRLEAERIKKAMANRYEVIPGTLGRSDEPPDYKPAPMSYDEDERDDD
jgi:hypothetical protein